MLFRHDINALRALAVAAVMLFHFQVPGFSGGFVGVDVFFVLSGFLMTAIIVSGISASKFNLLAFYQARCRRIVPALLVLCVFLLIFGFMYLPGDEYRWMIREMKRAVFFYSNVSFANSGSYFDVVPAEHWLLHTWSLSVEWQFYVAFPVVVFLTAKWLGTRALLPVLSLCLASSYLWSAYYTHASPMHAFYLLPSRAFEMLAGAVVYLLPRPASQRVSTALAATGFIMICGSIAFMDDDLAWPGYLAGVPVLGSALMLAGAREVAAYQWLPVRMLGNISYSAYLWHWPIVVVLYFCSLLSSPAWKATGIVSTLVLAYLSYELVEKRFKRAAKPSVSLAKYGLAALSVVIVASLLGTAVKRYPEIRPEELNEAKPVRLSTMYQQECTNERNTDDCKLGTGDVRFILYGDSHAQATATAVMAWNESAALQWSMAGCPLLTDFSMKNADEANACMDFHREKLSVLDSSYPAVPVVLFSHYSLYLEKGGNPYVRAVNGTGGAQLGQAYSKQFQEMVCRISKNHPVFLVTPIPEMPFDVYIGATLQRRLFGTDNDLAFPKEDYLERNRKALEMIELAAQNCGAAIIDPANTLCKSGSCLGTWKGQPLYFDDNHLSETGRLFIQGEFKSALQR